MANLSRETLCHVGLQLLSDHGLADVSMRRVAKTLDVAVSALYWHVKDKQSLLGAMVDHLVDTVDFAPATGHWKADLTARTQQLYHLLMTTRDAAELTASVLALNTGGHKIREMLAEVSPNTRTTDAVLAVLIGHATLNQQRLQAQVLGLDVPETTTAFPQVLAQVLN